MSGCDEYQRRYASLKERALDVYGWIQLTEQIPVAGASCQRFVGARRKLDQKFTALSSTKVMSLFQEFLKDESMERRESWENRERTGAISRVMLVGAGSYSDRGWEELKTSSDRIFLLAREFGPVKVPTEKGSAPAHELMPFWDSAQTAVAPSGFKWRHEALKNAVSLSESEVKEPPAADGPSSLTKDSDRADESVSVPQGGSLMFVSIARCRKCGERLLFPSTYACPNCGAESLKLLVGEKIVLPSSSFVDFAETLYLRRIWNSNRGGARKMIVSSHISSNLHGDHAKGPLLSLFSFFLCLAAGVKLSPFNIAKAASDRGYREQLLGKTNKRRADVAHKLRGLGRVDRVAKALWSRGGQT